MLDDYIERPDAEAAIIADSPVLARVLDGMEKDALERAVNAPRDDHDTRFDATSEVRLLRDIRARLRKLADGRKRSPGKQVA